MKDSLSTLPGFFPLSAQPDSVNALMPGEVPLLIRSDLYDLSAAASEQVLFSNRFGFALRIVDAFLVYNEAAATDASDGDITIGTTTGGAEIVAATAYTDSAASGAVQALTLVTNTLAADAEIFASHDQAGGAGTVYLFILLGIPMAGQLG